MYMHARHAKALLSYLFLCEAPNALNHSRSPVVVGAVAVAVAVAVDGVVTSDAVSAVVFEVAVVVAVGGVGVAAPASPAVAVSVPAVGPSVFIRSLRTAL